MNTPVNEIVFREVDVESLLDLRERVLSPGHPGRPVRWPYDDVEGAQHFGAFIDEQLVGCVSSLPSSLPEKLGLPVFHHSFQLHSMAVESAFQSRGLGRQIVLLLIDELRKQEIDCLWATARHASVGFYTNLGFEVFDPGDVVAETGFPITYVVLQGKNLRS